MKKIFKRTLATVMVVLMVLTSAPLSGFVGMDWSWLDFGVKASAATEGYYTYEVEDGKATITEVDTSISGNVTIPSVLGGYPVTTIGEGAFDSCYSLQSVTIPDSVTTIGDFAFDSCDSLQSVTIPNSVTTIGEGAFWGCVNLQSVTIPDSVTTIGVYAFVYCWNLESITIGNSVTTIGDDAFDFCDSLTSITVDKNNQYYCNDDCGALYDENKTVLIKYPVGNTRTAYVIPNSVTTIGDCAFRASDSLQSVTIPNSVTTIGDCAFWDCVNLQSVTIPDSVTTIGSYAFSACDSLTSITVDKNNQYYCNGDCGALYDKNKTVLIQYPIGNTRTAYAIPNSVTTIGDHAFDFCDSLQSVTIPNSVTSIGDYAFRASDSLQSVTIPDSVTTIGDEAFDSCDSLQSVTIPNSVTTIGSYAFSYCDSLTDVYYSGTQDSWNNISMGDGNEDLLNATIHYNEDDNLDEDSTGYKLRLRSDGAYSDSIAVGKEITFWTFLSNNGERENCNRAYAISFDTPGVFEVVKTKKTSASFDVTLKACKAGTTNMTVSDSETGAYVTIRLKANNPVEVLTLDEVKSMAKDYEGIRTNFYDYNGLYVNNFSYREKSDYYNVSMDVYNEKAHYGAAVSYDKNGNIHQFQIIDQQDKIPTHLWDALFDVYDWVNYELEVFHDKAYTNTVRSKWTPVSIDVPVGGHLVVTNNINNEIAFMSTITDLSLDFLFALGDIAFDDIPIDITYKVPEKVIRQIIAIAGSKALSSICTSIFKKYTKGVTAATAVSIISELSDKLEDVGVNYFALLKDAVKDTFDTETALNIGEDIGLKLVGLGGVKELLDGCDYINTFIKMYDMSASLLASEIAIYTPPEAPYVRKSNGVTVTSETELSSDCVLHTYVINENDNVMAEAESTIAKLNSNYEMHDITLYKSSQAVQPDAKIKVMIPIPNGYDKEKISVYWYKDDGTLELMNATVEGDYAVFETDHLSYYILTDHNHTDSNNDGVCEVCECTFCFCICHKTNPIVSFIWKILKFFYKYFNSNPVCGCGLSHY